MFFSDEIENLCSIFPELKGYLINNLVFLNGGTSEWNLARAKCIGDIVLKILGKSFYALLPRKTMLATPFEDAHWMSKISLDVLKYITINK